jgi:arylsulfatase A-like enzyme
VGPTWIVFTSDHGEMLGDHHLWRKTFAYEGSARVPLIVCPPQGSARHRSGEVVMQQDLMPSFLGMAGAPVPPGVDGRSLLPLLQAAPASGAWREYGHGEHSACYAPETGMQYLTDGRWKYIWYTLSGEEQLFCLEEDPQELHDLAADPRHRDRLVLWRERLVAELAPRPQDGLSDGRQLVPGSNVPAVRPGQPA